MALRVTDGAGALYVGELEKPAPIVPRRCVGCGGWFRTRRETAKCYVCDERALSVRRPPLVSR